MSNYFPVQLKESKDDNACLLYQKVMSRRFPSSEPLVYTDAKDLKSERLGKDAYFLLNGERNDVQFKLRRSTYCGDYQRPVIAIESHHVYTDGRPDKPGWAREDLSIKYLVYIQGVDKWDMCFPWDRLKALIAANLDTEWGRYSWGKAPNGPNPDAPSYHTWNKLVPIGEFYGIHEGEFQLHGFGL